MGPASFDVRRSPLLWLKKLMGGTRIGCTLLLYLLISWNTSLKRCFPSRFYRSGLLHNERTLTSNAMFELRSWSVRSSLGFWKDSRALSASAISYFDLDTRPSSFPLTPFCLVWNILRIHEYHRCHPLFGLLFIRVLLAFVFFSQQPEPSQGTTWGQRRISRMDCLQSATIEVQAQTTGQEEKHIPLLVTRSRRACIWIRCCTLLMSPHGRLCRCHGMSNSCTLSAWRLCDQPVDKHHMGA